VRSRTGELGAIARRGGDKGLDEGFCVRDVHVRFVNRRWRPAVVAQQIVVLSGSEVAGAPNVAAGERADGRLVERAVLPGEHAPVVDQVLDHRLGIRPVHLHGRDEAPELRDEREPAVAGCHRGGADERERSDAVRAVERELLCDAAPGRDADEVRGRDPVSVEHARSVGGEVRARVAGAAGRIGDRSAGVAVVVADHEPPALGEHPAEALLPPEHRAAEAHDQEDRRIRPVAEGLGAELDAVRLDHALHHAHPSRYSSWRRHHHSPAPRSTASSSRPFAARSRTRVAERESRCMRDPLRDPSRLPLEDVREREPQIRDGLRLVPAGAPS
jgi:hypothetical protein